MKDMKYFLVVGGTGVMGTAAIQGVREVYGSDATIVANWYGKEDTGVPVEGADHTVFGDINDPQCLEKLKSFNDGKYEYMFYATALGDVGFPINDSTSAQIERSNNLSFDPVKILEAALEIGTITTYSTFYLLKHQVCTYGAMGHSKEALEKWTLESGKSNRACIRAGLFESPSSRGIKLLLRKSAKNLDSIRSPLLRSYFENVKTSQGIEDFTQGIIQEERDSFGDSPTRAENLYQAHLELFRAENPVFINVSGSKIWLSKEAQTLENLPA